MNRPRPGTSTRGSLAGPAPAIVGGAAMLLLYACGLDSSGENASKGSGTIASSTVTGTSSGMGGEGSGAGGMGGAGGEGGASGGAGGMGGAGGAGGVLTFTWTAPTPSMGSGGMGGAGGGGGAGPSACAMFAYDLPDWLTFESPTPNRSTQISVEALCVGFNPDEPRARNVFTAAMPKWGLSVESERTNSVLQSDSWYIMVDDAGWLPSTFDPTLDMKFATNEPDPNVVGLDNATKFSTTTVPPPGGQHSRYYNVNARVVSAWVRGEGLPMLGCKDPQGNAELCYAHLRHKNVVGAYVNVTQDKWRRLSFAHGKAESDSLVLETRDVPAGAGVVVPPVSVVAYGAQGEVAGAYPSSYIRTEGVAVKRLAEKLYSTSTAALLPGGFMNVTMKVAPNFNMSDSLNEQSAAEYDLLFLEPKNRIYINKMERRLYVKIEGVTVTSDPLDFARDMELTITVEHNAGAPLKLIVDGAYDGNGEWTGEEAKPVDIPAAIYILSKDTGAEECADLRFISFD